MHHGTSEDVSVLLAAKVQAIDLTGIPPLVEGQGSLVVLQPLWNGTVDHNLEKTRAPRYRREGQHNAAADVLWLPRLQSAEIRQLSTEHFQASFLSSGEG